MEFHNATSQLNYLASASEALLKFQESEKFIKWALRALYKYLKPRHVSVALVDSERDSFLIKHSVGSMPFPRNLVALGRSSPLVEWFQNSCVHKVLLTSPELSRAARIPIPPLLAAEMTRHYSDLCAKIELVDGLAGYLLVGAPQTKKKYSRKDRAYFQTVANDIALEIEKQHYYQCAHFDPLTNLYNRRSLAKKLESVIQGAKESGEAFALCMVDLDNFKQINDRYSHLAGDEVLRAVARMLRKGIRQTDLAFRYGGEEFLLVLRNHSRAISKRLSTEEFSRRIQGAVERLRERIAAQPICLSEHELSVTASIGMTIYDGSDARNLEKIIHTADQAVYASKKAGKNRVTVYEKDVPSAAPADLNSAN